MGAIRGSRIIYLYRILADAATADATGIAFTTENGRTKSKDADSTATARSERRERWSLRLPQQLFFQARAM